MDVFKIAKTSRKKTKKLRKDKFWLRAKVAGYRARSAFKLIQIERKFNVLAKAKVCIDLCAAPGSWMQVASQYMVGSSVVIGVDRNIIKPIPKAITIRGDITTDEVRVEIKANIRDYLADIVLHDGAPNVGNNWIQDAYAQNTLVLSAFKLACEFLREGGTFVTKIFRSKDHTALEFVFKKLFKKVDSTKPVSSRFESAEAFVVCRGFLKPSKMDPKFFDPKYVFLNVESEPKYKLDLAKPEKRKAKPVGYEEGVNMLFKKFMLSAFIMDDNYIELLQEANEFEWDIEDNPGDKKEPEVKELIKDIKVLNTRDLKVLLTWRKGKKAALTKLDAEKKENEDPEVTKNDLKILALEQAYAKVAVLKEKIKFVKEDGKKKKMRLDEAGTEKVTTANPDTLDQEFDELEVAQEEINKLKAKLVSEVKTRVKKVSKRKVKLLEKMKLRQMFAGDLGPQETGHHELFSLVNINDVENLDGLVNDKKMSHLPEDFEDNEPKEETKSRISVPKRSVLDRTGRVYKPEGAPESDPEDSSDEEGAAQELEEKDDDDLDEFLEDLNLNINEKEAKYADPWEEAKKLPVISNPLLLDLVGEAVKEKMDRKSEQWFDQPEFEGLDTEEVEEYELNTAMSKTKERLEREKKKKLLAKFDPEEFEQDFEEASEDENDGFNTKDDSEAEDDDGDYSDTECKAPFDKPKSEEDAKMEQFLAKESDSDTDSDEETPAFNAKVQKEKKVSKHEKLDPTGLALATKMIKSQKNKNEVVNDAWNRYMFGDEALPKWFEKDEEKFNRPRIEVDQADLAMYEDRGKAVDSKTIKKAVEAQARKKRRLEKRMKVYRNKAKAICGRQDITERERATELRKISSKVTKKKADKKYVVMKTRMQGKKPTGEKGKMVDSRLKKDKRAKAARDKKKKGGRR